MGEGVFQERGSSKGGREGSAGGGGLSKKGESPKVCVRCYIVGRVEVPLQARAGDDSRLFNSK